jgi:signal transduction histidine kinase
MQRKILRREDKLRDFNKKLENRVNEKTKELSELNNTLEEKVLIEVAKNKQKEILLFEQSKMAAMGEMIGNIAHQWRQPLSAISTAASSIKLEKEFGTLTDDKIIKNVDAIVGITKHLSQTIDDFRNFFKSSKEKIEFDLNDIVNKNLTLMESAFKSNNITVKVQKYDELQLVGYPNEITQAILNILNNAKDALKVLAYEEEKYIFINYTKTNDYAILSIKDSGGGIKEDIIEKIFEPYFTTKHKSQGTGIGLYMTRQIIVDHMKGEIEVHNSKYKYNEKEYLGAEFVITLPLA